MRPVHDDVGAGPRLRRIGTAVVHATLASTSVTAVALRGKAM